MRDLLNIFIDAQRKKIFNAKSEFEACLSEINESDSKLILDWDDGAGEEWARFIYDELGIIYMINSKIGLIFARKEYTNEIIDKLYLEYEVCIVESYALDEWLIDLKRMMDLIPEINWHTSEEAVNSNQFSLNDLYFATI